MSFPLSQRRTVLFLLLLLLGVPGSSAWGWWNEGHMVVAQIAYERLTPRARARFDRLIALYPDPKTQTFVKASCWADNIKGDGDHRFDTWHFIHQPLSLDGTATHEEDVAEVNVLQGMNRCIRTLKNRHASPLEQAQMLRLLLHLVGDVHEPMHCINGFSKAHPEGDQGGNLYAIADPDFKNLHTYWDVGAGILESMLFPLDPSCGNKLKALSRQIVHFYPYRANPEARNMNFKDWLKEGYSLSKTVCYAVPENTAPSKAYSLQARKIVQKRLALAGYRLARLLNRIYSRKRKG